MTGFGVHRSLLFRLLFDAVRQAGIAVETARPIAGSALTSGGRRHLVSRTAARLGRVRSDRRDGIALAVVHPFPGTRVRRALDHAGSGGIAHALPDWLDQRYRRADQMAGIMRSANQSPAAAIRWPTSGACARPTSRAGPPQGSRHGAMTRSRCGPSRPRCWRSYATPGSSSTRRISIVPWHVPSIPRWRTSATPGTPPARSWGKGRTWPCSTRGRWARR